MFPPESTCDDIYVTRVATGSRRVIACEFNDGAEYRTFDITPLLDREPFHALVDEAIFRAVECHYGVPNWNDEEIDIAPEYIYENGTRITREEFLEYMEAANETS